MTGELVWTIRTDHHPHDRVVFILERGELHYRDQRKLQGIWLARDEREEDRIMGHQGPDALDVDDPGFRELLAEHRGRIKAVLMDQEIVAGLGNIATDEILWRARIHPARHANELNAAEVRRLHRSMRRVLGESIRQGRIPDRRGWLTGVRDQARPACPRCGATITRTRTGGRRSYWCPRCQPRTSARVGARRAAPGLRVPAQER
jgi:formamidopyrimidine-DNA glycosylase